MGKTGWILICALCAGGALWEPAATRADGAAPLFEPTNVASIELGLSAESAAALDADPDTYVPATLTLTLADTEYAELTVGLRLRGHTSFRTLAGKAAFKIKLNEFVSGQKLLGLKKLTLNNMVQDRSMIHEALAYELFRGLGVAAPRTGYAYVRVNGEDYGLYLNLETLDDVALPRWFGSTQHLYEGGATFDTEAADIGSFEIDEGNGDRSDLTALVADVGGSGQKFSERVADTADLGQMVRMWAVERYIGHWDGYAAPTYRHPNNYYLHSDATGRFSFLPWGTDQTFADLLVFDTGNAIMFEACLSEPGCLEAYRAALASIPGFVDDLGLDARAAQLASTLEPYERADPRREYTYEQIVTAVADARAFLARRPATLFDQRYWAQGPPLAFPPPASPGIDPGGGEPAGATADRTPPETVIDRAPAKRVGRTEPDARARFAFSSSEPGSTFECRRDAREWRTCASPTRLRARAGRHVFRVRAIDPAGNVDPTPARARWRVAGRSRPAGT